MASKAAAEPSDEIPLDTESAAPIIGWASQTLRNKRVTGGGPPYFKVGRKVLYLPSDLRAFMAARRVTSTSQARL
jgi:hypothetical protein